MAIFQRSVKNMLKCGCKICEHPSEKCMLRKKKCMLQIPPVEVRRFEVQGHEVLGQGAYGVVRKVQEVSELFRC